MAEEKFAIVMVSPWPEDASMIRGGVQASVLGLSRALLATGEVTRVIGFSIPLAAGGGRQVSAKYIDGSEVIYLTAPYGFLSSAIIHLPRVLKAIRSLNRPLVHIHGTGLFQATLALLLRLHRIPFVWTLHGITEKETRERYRGHPTPGNAARHVFYTALERALLKIAPHIFVDTPYVRKEIKTANNVHVLPIGIFTDEFTPLASQPHSAPIALSLGVIDPRKGHHLTLEAFARVKKAIPEAQLIIAGSLTSPAYGEQLKARTKELGLTCSVEFLIDRPRPEIIAALARARILALHSQEESQGIALCEALAAGVPCVATRVGGIPYVITDGQDGLLTPYGDIAAFAAAMQRLLEDNALHGRMAGQAVQSATRFDWKTIAAEVVRIYGRAAGR